MSVSLLKPMRHIPHWTHYGPVSIPGTNVRALFRVRDSRPSIWVYSLWNEGDDECLAVDSVEFPPGVTPEQVARIAYLLEVEYS